MIQTDPRSRDEDAPSDALPLSTAQADPDGLDPLARDPEGRREVRRLDRQFSWIRRRYPRAGGMVQRITRPGWALLRVPVAVLFMLGGVLAILPVFGLWMIPVGLALLAVDVPLLRRPVAASVIRLRRRIELRRARKRRD